MDYLRAGALLLLILYHTLLVFNGWDWWRVKSVHAGHWADYIVDFIAPWRMPLVFFVGGVAARFMFEKAASWQAFTRERASKLLTAFIFAIIAFVPIQRWVRLDEVAGYRPPYLEYLVQQAPFAIQRHGFSMPDFGHAWFLPYLFTYSVLAVAIWHWAPKLFERVQRRVEATPIWAIVLTAMGWLAFVEGIVLQRFPTTGYLVPDIGGHLKFFPVFALGVLVAKSTVFSENLSRVKTRLWLVAGVTVAISLFLQWRFLDSHPNLDGSPTAWYTARGVFGGVMLFSVIAFAGWALNRPSRFLTYATDAILPVYLMHQAVLVIVADRVVRHQWPVGIEFVILFSTTLGIPLIIYHLIVRPMPWLRMLFGLRPHIRGGPVRASAPIAQPEPDGLLHR